MPIPPKTPSAKNSRDLVYIQFLVKHSRGNLIFQDDLRKLKDWSDKWLLKFNPDKCKVMHVGHNHSTEYFIEQDSKLSKLAEVTEEKDLGVINTLVI